MSKKKKIRKKFREGVFKRDNYTCQICGAKYSSKDAEPEMKKINAHHITDRSLLPGGGYIIENGITLCDENGNYFGKISCHQIAELWHIYNKSDRYAVYMSDHIIHPNFLYNKIDSSLELVLSKIHKKKK